MTITTFVTSPLETNTYVVINGNKAFVVDPGGRAEEISAFIRKEGATAEAVLLTHGHFDHTGGVAALQREGAQVFIHRDDARLANSVANLAAVAGYSVEHFTPDVTLAGGERLTVAGVPVSVIHTAGHTAGGVCYDLGDVLFTGDTLFELSYGRTDFPSGNFAELKNSVLNKLFNLEGDRTVYSGHGAPTTLEFERKHNPITSDRR